MIKISDFQLADIGQQDIEISSQLPQLVSRESDLTPSVPSKCESTSFN